jgi:hypothetical protein
MMTDIAVDNRGTTGQVSNEDSTMPSIMESICTAPIKAGQKDIDPCETTPPDGDLAGFSTGASGDQVGSSLVCLGEVEPHIVFDNNSGNISESSLKDSPKSSALDVSVLVCPIISKKTDDAGENPGTTLSVPSNPENSDMKSPSTSESGSGNKAEPLGSSNDNDSPEGLRVLTKADDVGDHPRVTSPILAARDHSGLVVAPDGVETEIHSGNKMECAVKEYSESSPFNVRSIGCTTSTTADDVGDHPREAALMSVTADNSGVVKCPGVTEKKSGGKIQPSPKESPKTSPLDIESIEGPTPLPGSLESSGVHNCGGFSKELDMPSVEAKATECSGEAIVEGLEISQKDIDFGAVVEPADTAPSDTITSDEAPSDKGQLAASCVREDKEDPMFETVHSFVAESTTADVVPKDHDEMPLPPEIQSSEGDCVEVHNMEVDPSEGLSEKGSVSSSVPLEDSKCPEAEMGDAIDASEVCGILPSFSTINQSLKFLKNLSELGTFILKAIRFIRFEIIGVELFEEIQFTPPKNIVTRVIMERKTILENENLAYKIVLYIASIFNTIGKSRNNNFF